MALDLARLAEAIAAQHAHAPFSGVLFIQAHGQPLWAQGYGWANHAAGQPNTVETRFGMASGNKTLTALAICQLIEQGRLRFETRLAECLPGVLPRADPAITLHHLLCHSSGLPDYFDEEVDDDYGALWKNRPMYQLLAPADFLPLFQDRPMQFTPGEKWHYNNAGYIVLGLVIEHVAGVSYTDYVGTHLLQPLQMQASGFFRLDALPERTACGYLECGETWRTNIYSIPVVGGPDGGLFTTAPDMAKFWEGLLGGRVVSPLTLEKMLTPYWPTLKQRYGYGFWLGGRDEAVYTYYLLGEDPGVAFLSAYYPASALQFTFLSNYLETAWPMCDCVRAILKTAA